MAMGLTPKEYADFMFYLRYGYFFDTLTLPATVPSGGTFSLIVSTNQITDHAVDVDVFLRSPNATFVGGGSEKTVLIPAGSMSASAAVTTTPVNATTTIPVLARNDGVVRNGNVAEAAATIKGVTFPGGTTVKGGNTLPVTINLNGKAGDMGVVITITSDTPSAIKNQTIRVAAGDDTMTSIIDTVVGGSGTVVLTFSDPNKGTPIKETVTVTK